MRRIFLMRHGQPDNPSGVIYSNLPGFPLNEVGVQQAHQAGEFLKSTKIDVVVTSGLERAQQTGEIVAEHQAEPPQMVVDPRIRDNDLGERAGVMTAEEYVARWSEIWQERIDGYMGAEPPLVTQKRLREGFDDNLAKFPGANILFVSHGDPIAFLRQSLLGVEIAPSYPDWKTPKAGIWEIFIEEPNRTKLIFQPTNG